MSFLIDSKQENVWGLDRTTMYVVFFILEALFGFQIKAGFKGLGVKLSD